MDDISCNSAKITNTQNSSEVTNKANALSILNVDIMESGSANNLDGNNDEHNKYIEISEKEVNPVNSDLCVDVNIEQIQYKTDTVPESDVLAEIKMNQSSDEITRTETNPVEDQIFQNIKIEKKVSAEILMTDLSKQNSVNDHMSETEVPTISATEQHDIVPATTVSDLQIKTKPCLSIPDDSESITGQQQVGEVSTDTESKPLMSYRQLSDKEVQEYSGAESDASSHSSPVFSDHNLASDDETKEKEKTTYIPVVEITRTKGELLPEDLPPIEDLKITIAEDEKLLVLGKVSGFVGTLGQAPLIPSLPYPKYVKNKKSYSPEKCTVIIQSSPNTPALNEETVLFYEDRRVFGKVFEIFGPVSSPFYSVRFNSIEDIKNRSIANHDLVYCAPNLEEITQYIFVDQLKKMKGSDASWKDNNEPPDRYVEYSDDEQERRSKSKRKEGKHKDTEVEENNKTKKKELSFDTLPGGFDRNTSTQQNCRGRKKKHRQYDRDRPEADVFLPAGNSVGNQNVWNCWPPRGNFTNRAPQRAPPPRNNGPNPCIAPANFNPQPRQQVNMMGGTWNNHDPRQNGGMNLWTQSMNSSNFNARHNFPYQGPRQMMNMNRTPFFSGQFSDPGNQNLFLNSLQNGSRPVIVDSRFIQNNQQENPQIGNPYGSGIPRQ